MNIPTVKIDTLDTYPDYLSDESRYSGKADGIIWPQSTAEISHFLSQTGGQTTKITIQGARTGITAGAVPEGGIVINLSRMNRISGAKMKPDGMPSVIVQPGVTLTALKAFLDSGTVDMSGWSEESRNSAAQLQRQWQFTPDPTETTASLGGMAACNASGACSFLYGAARQHIQYLKVVLPDGDILDLPRGRYFANHYNFELPTKGGRTIKGILPDYFMPKVKNAAGYFVRPNMDLIDLFIGSEGTLGIITELHLALQPKPATVWGVVAFIDSPEQVITLAEILRAQGLPAVRIAALEYFDANALDLLRHDMADGTLMGLPLLSDEWREALYIEIYASSIQDMAQAGETLIDTIGAVGGSGDETWVAAEETSLLQLKTFRHAVPERVNARIAQRRRQHPGLTKLGTDFAVPDNHFRGLMSIYRTDLEKANLEYVIFGHIGDNHVHVNILPRNMNEYNYGRQLYLRWAELVVKWGGSVSAEHGIGKLKKALLQIMYGERGLTGMMHLKKVFDPQFRLNSGNLFNPS